MTDDDIRSMLRSKAAEVEVSPDAWEQITARLQEAPPRQIGRRLAVAGAAAAAIAGTVFVANLPGTSPQVATRPETSTPTTALATSHVFASPAGAGWDAERTAHAYLLNRTGLEAGDGEVVADETSASTILFRDGPVFSEVVLRRLAGQWVVDSAVSDLVPIYDPVYEQGLLSAEVAIEADGELTITTGGPVGSADDVTEQRVARLDQVPVRASLPDRPYVRVAAVLAADDGAVGVSETWVTDHTDNTADPGVPVGSYVAVWPAVDSVGLSTLQQDADAGRRGDLLDPSSVASGFLAEALPPGTGVATLPFQQGDNTSGEVPFEILDPSTGASLSSGTILLRTTGEPGGIWTVTGADSDDLEIVRTRREGATRVADVRSELTGTLTWTGATPIEVQAGQTVSIGRPDSPEIGSYPVVVRLMDGNRTLAIVAGMS